MKETKIIEQLMRQCPSNASIKLGIGDDSAVLQVPSREPLVCADMLMEGVHFLLDSASAEQIAHKALAVNLSDIAAMGGEALSAYICLALPRSRAEAKFLDRLYQGFGELARKFDVAIAGGDTNIWQGPLVISISVIGQVHRKGAITRQGAQVGDVIMVTGKLGGSLEAHHLSFTPRLAEAKALMDHLELHSMIDLSDGLGKDLREICRQSGVAACLDPALIPLADQLLSLPWQEALQKALQDGEDFELCFTLSESEASKFRHDSNLPQCYPIGRIVAGQGLYWGTGQTIQEPIESYGYEHQSEG
jgi:thiamine-monophosphate kinase